MPITCIKEPSQCQSLVSRSKANANHSSNKFLIFVVFGSTAVWISRRLEGFPCARP
jgi:hypothetical protein